MLLQIFFEDKVCEGNILPIFLKFIFYDSFISLKVSSWEIHHTLEIRRGFCYAKNSFLMDWKFNFYQNCILFDSFYKFHQFQLIFYSFFWRRQIFMVQLLLSKMRQLFLSADCLHNPISSFWTAVDRQGSSSTKKWYRHHCTRKLSLTKGLNHYNLYVIINFVHFNV